jgi:hypothetical protein
MCNVTRTELEFIAQNTAELVQLIRSNSATGEIGLGLSPFIALVAEESFHHLNTLAPQNSEAALKSPLFESFSEAVMKLRVRIKLFDDNRGGLDRLLETLSLTQRKSTEWFNSPHRGSLGSLKRWLQPDLGVFYLEEHVIGTTHTALLTIGLTYEHLQAMSSDDMRDLEPFVKEFSVASGSYLGQLATYLQERGCDLDVSQSPRITRPDLPITHNDHHGRILYPYVSDQLGLAHPELSAAVIFLIAQINFVERVLTHLLAPTSTLLLRARYLTAYHATTALQELNAREVQVHENQLVRITRDILNEPDSVFLLESRQARNIMAHYGLLAASRFLTPDGDPFDDVLVGLCQRNRSDVTAITQRQLLRISDAFVSVISKTTLKNSRSLFGDHA